MADNRPFDFEEYEDRPAGGGGLGGLLGSIFGGGGGGSTLDLYGDLFTPEQKAALQKREMTQGLFRMAETLGKMAQPTRVPNTLGGTLGALGAGLGAFGGGTGEETALKAMEVAEKVKKAKADRAMDALIAPVYRRLLEKEGLLGLSPGTLTSQLPGAATTPPPGPAPAAPPSSMTTSATAADAAAGAPPAPGAPPPLLPIPPAPPGGRITPADYGVPAAPQQNTGLLGAPDQVVGPDGQPLPQGVLPNTLASLTGGMPGGELPFRLASAATLGAGPSGGREARVKFWTDQGAPQHVAEGIADRVGVESSYRPDAIGDGGTSGGLYQHHADRLSRLKNYAAQQNRPWTDPNVQDQFAATEVKGGDAIAAKGWSEIVAAPDRQTAAKLWDRYFERSAAGPGAGGGGSRRGGRFAGAGPDAGRIPIGGGGGDEMQMLSALLRLTGGGGGSDDEDPLAQLASMTSGGGAPDTVVAPDRGGSDLPIQQATTALAPFATGNARLGQPSSVAGVGPDMSGRIERMVQAMPPAVRERFLITSGYRDAEQQARVNSRVTNSRHMHGAAVDLAKDPVVLDWITKNPQYGLGFPLSSDPRETNHLEMIDPASGGRLPIMRAQYSPGGAAPPVGGPVAPAEAGGKIPGLDISPQGLAALNALTKMAGHGDAFSSLLETYYKSPGYLGEKARTEAEAQKGVALEMDPKIEAAKAKATQQYIQENQTHQSALDMARDLVGKGVYLNKKTGRMEPIDNAAQALAEIDRIKEQNKADLQLVDTTLTFPGETQPRTVQMTGAQARAIAEGRGAQIGGVTIPPMTGIKLGKPVPSEEDKADIQARGAAQTEMYKAGQKALDTSHAAVLGANQRAPYYGSMLTAMQGFQPGATAEMRLTAMQYLKDAGVIKGENVSQGEALKLAGERLAFLALPPGQGSWAIAERQMLKTSLGGMSLTPEGLTEAIRMMQQLDDYDRKVSEIHRQVADKNNGLPNLLEAQRRVEALGPPLTAQQEAALQRLQQPAAAASGATAPGAGPAVSPEQAQALRAEAAAAIKSGRSKAAVIERLKSLGVNTEGL